MCCYLIPPTARSPQSSHAIWMGLLTPAHSAAYSIQPMGSTPLPESASKLSDRKSPVMAKHPSEDLNLPSIVDSVQVGLHDIFEGVEYGLDPVYHAKAICLNAVFHEIRMGWYQVCPLMPSPKGPKGRSIPQGTHEACHSGICFLCAGLDGSPKSLSPLPHCLVFMHSCHCSQR